MPVRSLHCATPHRASRSYGSWVSTIRLEPLRHRIRLTFKTGGRRSDAGFDDEVSPDLTDVIVPVRPGISVLALSFATDRAPYVVKTDGHGGVEREAPWRDGTTTRSARRRELLRILASRATVPAIEVYDMQILVNMIDSTDAIEARLEIATGGRMFIAPYAPVMLPKHLFKCSLQFHEFELDISSSLKFYPSDDSGISGHFSAPHAERAGYLPFRDTRPIDVSARDLFLNDTAASRSATAFFTIGFANTDLDARITMQLGRDPRAMEDPLFPGALYRIARWSIDVPNSEISEATVIDERIDTTES